jgi:hypothetical protein
VALREKPEKDQDSLRAWKGGTIPGIDCFRVTWDRIPMEKHRKNNVPLYPLWGWLQECFLEFSKLSDMGSYLSCLLVKKEVIC